MPEAWMPSGLAVEHPRDAAEKVTRHAFTVGRALAEAGALSRSPDEVSPQPCEALEGTVAVDEPVPEPPLPAWWVDYSPYQVFYIGHVELVAPSAAVPALAAARERLEAAGWRERASVLAPNAAGDEPVLLMDAPDEGYGARLGVALTESGRSRITVHVASPCLRHPAER
ncbi:hypothetical protein [Actinomadura parmotrematis]|uniref:Uncharacterized protein n=1 Tax=Actinomadura parmotrematis TaxID=2864039 RepID=A0ABS7FZ26_9ACTN|nr:hypothetical protein [Actinomadura parmotrematis]MBW8484899.1 hypothetical protein [Actinomadura parmotrematis]